MSRPVQPKAGHVHVPHQHRGHKRGEPPAKPVEVPTPPSNAIPKPNYKPHEDTVICYSNSEAQATHGKKREWEKFLTNKWSTLAVQPYDKDFTLASYLQAFGPAGQEPYESVMTLCEIAFQGNTSPSAASAKTSLFNMISAALFAGRDAPIHQPIPKYQITPEKMKKIIQDFEKTERNRATGQAHNPAAWKALNDSFAIFLFPAEAIIVETGGMNALCMKRYAPMDDRH